MIIILELVFLFLITYWRFEVRLDQSSEFTQLAPHWQRLTFPHDDSVRLQRLPGDDFLWQKSSWKGKESSPLMNFLAALFLTTITMCNQHRRAFRQNSDKLVSTRQYRYCTGLHVWRPVTLRPFASVDIRIFPHFERDFFRLRREKTIVKKKVVPTYMIHYWSTCFFSHCLNLPVCNVSWRYKWRCAHCDSADSY